MRRLMLLRHAKAARQPGLADFDRPLKPLGREQSRALGEFMAANAWIPAFALVSTAIRARETFDLVDIFLHPPPERAEEPLIYEAPSERLLALVRRLPPKHDSALLVGHNPGFEELTNELISTGEEEMLARFKGDMPTAGLAVIDFHVDRWSEIKPATGLLALFVAPAFIDAQK